jgi:hypothetical protein
MLEMFASLPIMVNRWLVVMASGIQNQSIRVDKEGKSEVRNKLTAIHKNAPRPHRF